MAKTAHTIRISSFLEVLRLEGHGRIARIAELRGALILLVLIYHLLYDITLFFPAAAPRLWLLGDAMRPLRAVVPGLFILLCGMCTHLSRNNMRRGLWCALFAGGIRLVSGIVSPACPIRFGILHLLALCLLLWCALHRPLAQMHLPPWAAMVGGGLLFALTYRLEQGYALGCAAVRRAASSSPARKTTTIKIYPVGRPSKQNRLAPWIPTTPKPPTHSKRGTTACAK